MSPCASPSPVNRFASSLIGAFSGVQIVRRPGRFTPGGLSSPPSVVTLLFRPAG
jgi:hypothetical protein